MNTFHSLRSTYLNFIPSKIFLKRLSGVAILQVLQMAISATIGFFIVRNLSKEEYAIFNLLNVGSATLLVWSGFSISSIFIPFANREGLAPQELRSTTTIFRKLNTPLLFVGILTGTSFWIISAYRNGWLNGKFVLSVFFILIASFCQYFYKFPESAYKVSEKPFVPFKISIQTETLRLILTVATLVAVPTLFHYTMGIVSLMVVVAISTIYGLVTINSRFQIFELHASNVTKAHRDLYWNLLRPLIFPTYFFYTSIFFREWLIYLISGSRVIADAAALGRLMALFALMDKAVELVVLPRLGAIQDVRRFIQRLSLSFVSVFIMGLGLFMTAWFFPDFWLWILGNKYTNLNYALLWAVGAAGVERLSGLILSSQLARGETKNQWWVPLIAITAYISYVLLFGLDSAEKATIGIFISAVVNLFAQLSIFGWRFHNDLKYIFSVR